MSTFKNLHVAFKNKDDEYYTLYEDIEKELSHYFEFFKNKTIYCNCDNPHISNFPRYFIRFFHKMGISRLITTGYNRLSNGYVLDVKVNDIPPDAATMSNADLNDFIDARTQSLSGNGDFASYECMSYLKESDIVVTNPPFSKFREFFELIVSVNKDLIVLAPFLALSYNVVLPYVSTGRIKVSDFSKTNSLSFFSPHIESHMKSFRKVRWLTTLNINSKDQLILCKYDSGKYSVYDESPNIININRLNEIPDYDGIMGVPVTYLEHHNPRLFEIVAYTQKHYHINKKQTFVRVLIRRRQNSESGDTKSQKSAMDWEDYQVNDLNTDVQTNLSNWM